MFVIMYVTSKVGTESLKWN